MEHGNQDKVEFVSPTRFVCTRFTVNERRGGGGGGKSLPTLDDDDDEVIIEGEP